MREFLLAAFIFGLGYLSGYLTQEEHVYLMEQRFEILFERVLLAEDRARVQGRALDRTWQECLGVEEAHGAGR